MKRDWWGELMANPWFRLYSEFAFDPKIQSMSEILQRRYIMLLCLKCNDDLRKLSEEELAFALRIDEQTLHETKTVFLKKELIDGDWRLTSPLCVNQDKRLPSHIWSIIRTRIFKRDNYTCQYCGQYGKKLECDHIVPVARGGKIVLDIYI